MCDTVTVTAPTEQPPRTDDHPRRRRREQERRRRRGDVDPSAAGAGQDGSPKKDQEPTPEQKRAVKQGLILTGLLLAALVCSMMPLPFPAIAGVLGIAAGVWAVLYLIAGIRSGRGAQAIVSGIAGILISGYLVVAALGTVLIWPIRAEFEQCTSSAITEQASASCQKAYDDGIAGWFEKVTGQKPPTQG